MRLSTKSRFAVSAMIDVALREQLGPVSLAAISARQQISQSYLEQLFSKLRQRGLLESTRGPGGGYSLGRAAQAINLADIINAVDGFPTNQGGVVQGAGEGSRLLTYELWNSLNTKMTEHLQSITLRHLVDEQLAKGAHIEERPAIQRGVFAQGKQKPLKIMAPNSVFALAGTLATSR
jgi:Rrf2 family iron-sulfur cluster assembly transcriptional regulator